MTRPEKLFEHAMAMSEEQADADLLVAWQRGDQSSGNSLFRRHAAMLDRFFRNKVPEVAEDLLQKSFLALVEKKEAIPAGVSVRAYLVGIARNHLLMHLRRLTRDRAQFDPNTFSVVDAGAAQAKVVAAADEQRLIAEAMQHLPVDYQIALELYYWEGLSLQEIADATDTSAVNIKARLARGRAKLREHLETRCTGADLLQRTLDGLDKWLAGLPGIVRRGASSSDG